MTHRPRHQIARLVQVLAGVGWVVLCACAGEDGPGDAGSFGSGPTSTGPGLGSGTRTPTTGTLDSTSGAATTADGSTSTGAAASTSSNSGEGSSGEGSSSSDGSSGTGSRCEGDEPQSHGDPATALELPGLDCAAAPMAGAGVLGPGLEWWSFQGTDPDGGCEPDSVRIEASASVAVNVCAFAPDCVVTCTQGVADAGDGCCGINVVEFSADCGPGDSNDSTPIVFLVGNGAEQCLPVTFEYEF